MHSKVNTRKKISCLDGLAWDWITKKLYWTDVTDRDIEVLDLQTNYRTKLFNASEDSNLRTIVLDPTTRCVYNYIN